MRFKSFTLIPLCICGLSALGQDGILPSSRSSPPSQMQLIADLKNQLASGVFGQTLFTLKSLTVTSGILTIVQCTEGLPPSCLALEVPLSAINPEGVLVSSGDTIAVHPRDGADDAAIHGFSNFDLIHQSWFQFPCRNRSSAAAAARDLQKLIALDQQSKSMSYPATAGAAISTPIRAPLIIGGVFYEVAVRQLAQGQALRGAILLLYASNAGHGPSSYRLATIYENGEGVSKDFEKAQMFYLRALQQGEIDARPSLARVQAAIALAKEAALRAESADLAARQNQIEQQVLQHLGENQAEANATANGATAQPSGTQGDITQRVSFLQQDIEMHERAASRLEKDADVLASGRNCSGAAAGLCQGLGEMGAARQRGEANKERNEADHDREEIQRLQGEDVTAHQRRTTSFGDTLTEAINQQSAATDTVSLSPSTTSSNTAYPVPSPPTTNQTSPNSFAQTSSDFTSCRFVTSSVSVNIRNLSALDSSCTGGTHPALADWTNRTGRTIECKWTLNESPGVNINDYQATGVNDLRCVRNPEIKFVCYDADDKSHSDCTSAAP